MYCRNNQLSLNLTDISIGKLGGFNGVEDDQYVLGDDALAVLKDIKRWLRLYDEKTNRLDVARLLAEANLVRGDLLEILASWPENAAESSFRSKMAMYSRTSIRFYQIVDTC